MIEGVQQLRCGGCGEEFHRIYKDSKQRIITECSRCKSKTIISVSEPHIVLDWTEGSDGILAGF